MSGPNFEDLFDWEKESNVHYYSMLQAYRDAEEFQHNMIVKPIKIIVEHESINESRKVRKSVRERIKLRLDLSIKTLRAKGRIK